MTVRTGATAARTQWRSWAGGVTAGLLVLSGLVASAPADATPNEYARSIGTLTGTVTTTDTGIPVAVRTSAPCPAGTTTINGFFESVDAGIAPGALVISANQTDVNAITTSGIPLDNNLKGLAQTAGKVLVNGSYDVQLVCYPDAFSSPTAQFDGTFTVSGGVGTGPGPTATWVVPGATATTTALTLSPPDSVAAGAPLTLSASVTPAAAAGSVQFGEVVAGQGTVPVGAPVPLSAGAAGLTTTTLTAGTHDLVATFVPSGTTFLTSVSPTRSVTVLTAGQQATTTTLAVSPSGTAPQGSTVTLTATIAPAAAGGTVTFLADGAAIGTGAVAAGTATFSTAALDPGSRSLSARFVPADVAAFAGSSSAAVLLTVAPSTGGGGAFVDDLTVDGANGSAKDSLGIILAASTPCPGGDSVVATMKGPGAWAAGLTVPVEGALTTAGSTVSLKRVDLVAPITPGKYFVFVTCQDSLTLQSSGFFVARLWFYDSEHWLSQDPVLVGIPTVSSIVVKPQFRQDVGLPVVLEATLDQVTAKGKVRFDADKDGTVTALGEAVLKAGRAQVSVPALEFGLYYVTATFVPDPVNSPPYNTSVSPETFFVMAKGLPPVPQREAAVTGKAAVGSTVTCAARFAGAASLGYRWERNRVRISGATRATYRPVAADRGAALRCRATAANPSGAVYRVSPPVRVAR
ncbi:Ig-like domain-containing protein [Kineosporia sp. A_224]|uniref:Ig-like domain-containing protein n=1 Tax=Kineosporia sp. A_224 TaxID=1962180 RepID=UPI00117B2F82|nr:Ig-like domain-containing protein [Kineosporia sp. A_224]